MINKIIGDFFDLGPGAKLILFVNYKVAPQMPPPGTELRTIVENPITEREDLRYRGALLEMFRDL